MTTTAFITCILDDKAQQMRSVANTLEAASKRIEADTNQGGNIPLDTLARALLPLGLCVVNKVALATALDAMCTIDLSVTDITEDTTSKAFERVVKHLRDSLTGFNTERSGAERPAGAPSSTR